MRAIHVRGHNVLLTGLIILLVLTACGPSGTQSRELPAATDPAAQPPAGEESAPQTSGTIVIEAGDPCSLLTKEQVEAGFGKSVTEVTPQQKNIGQECEFIFSEDSDLRVTFYEGAEAKNFFAVLITAVGQSCEEFLSAIFDAPYPPLAEKYPSADQSLLGLPLGDLYRQYVGVLGECMYIHSRDRADAGDNVLASETIFLNASSNVAVLGDERVVELTYQEPLSEEIQQALQQGTSKEAFHAIADPYRQEVLSDYTEILIGLLKQAAAQ